jgi:hypothetical protein
MAKHNAADDDMPAPIGMVLSIANVAGQPPAARHKSTTV